MPPERSMTRTAFIISTGRTGTGFLARLVNETSTNGFSTHEPKPAFRRRCRKILRRGDTALDRLVFKRSRDLLIRTAAKTWYVENNFQLFSAVPMLRRLYPETRIILIIRDGRDVTTSYLNRGRYIHQHHITPANVPGDPAAQKWESWSPVQKLAWYWVTVNRTALAHRPDAVFRFEDLFDPESNATFDLLDGLEGLEYDREKVASRRPRKENINKENTYPAYAEWPSEWKTAFDDIAGPLMSELDYAH